MAGTAEAKKIQTAGLEAFQGLVEGMQEHYLQTKDVAQYSLAKQETAAEGYASSYRLTKNGEPVGDAINIPKDQFLKSVRIGIAAEDGSPVEGCRAGEKYIEMFVASQENGGEGQHLYLMLSEIMKPLSPGDGIAVSDENAVSIRMDEAHANGLSAGPDGLRLSLATAAAAGAMSAADKEKLDGMEFMEITKEEVKALFTSGSGGSQQA